MTVKRLPTINYDSTPGYNEFSFQHKMYSEEFVNRSLISSQSGIVDDIDPSSSPFDTGRSLNVAVSSINPLTVDISKGMAVTPSHQLIIVDSSIPTIPFADLVADKVYVITIEYSLVQSEEKRANRFGIPVEVRLERPSSIPFGGETSTLSNVVTVASITDFNNPSIFSSERKENLVVIAVVTARADPVTGQLSLLVDLTKNSFEFNRPWFTPLDVEHRSKVGSGVVSDNNPHGTELQDLSSAGFTLYQQLLPKGGVYAKDATYGYPGTFCTELVSSNRFQVDHSGKITATNELGQYAGRYFITLTKLPIRVGSLYLDGKPWLPIPYHWIPGTRYLVLGSLEKPFEYEGSLIVEYFSVSALSSPQESLTHGVTTFTVGEPTIGQEYIISQGLAMSELTQTSLSLPSLLGQIKKNYQVLCTGDGALFTHPQPIVPVMKVTDVVGKPQVAINQAPLNGNAVRLLIGLTGLNEAQVSAPGFDLNLKLRLSGIDENGSVIEEDLAFRASQWKDQVPTSLVEEPLQFKTTKNKFASITSIKSINTGSDPDNAGTDSLISIWANILESKENQELAKVASFFWNGSSAIKVRDERTISTGLQRPDQRQDRFPTLLPENDAAFIQEFFSVLLDPPITDPNKHSKRIALELDDDRYLSETWKSFSTIDASALIKLVLYSNVTPGMTLRISADKYITFVTSLTGEKGEVLIPTSTTTGDTELKNSLLAAINDPTFDSTWYGEATTDGISLSRPEAYPDGFIVNDRKFLNFSSDLTSGTISFILNGTTLTVSMAASHTASIIAILDAVEAADLGVTAAAYYEFNALRQGVAFNGPPDGSEFTLTGTNIGSPGTVGTVGGITPPSVAFIFTQPINGELPTSHLPDRFLDSNKKWKYLTRALPWVGPFLEGELRLNSDSVSSITNGDQIEIVPGKIIKAIRASGSVLPSTDRAAGEFGVNTLSLVDTLSSIITTINHPAFNSGVVASMNPTNNGVLFYIGGYASSNMHVLVEGVAGTWQLTPYTARGAGDSEAHGFIKTVLPLDKAEWRYQLVNPDTDYPFGVGSWSPWIPMMPVSSTSFKFSGPRPPGPPGPPGTGYSLYTAQIRLEGKDGKPNSFSMYQISPQISGTTITALNSRLSLIDGVTGELTVARGTAPNLNTRISTVVNAAGVRVQDTELTAARTSNFSVTKPNLATRLNVMESTSYWLSGAATINNTMPNPRQFEQLGLENKIVSGPSDNLGNSNNFLLGTGTQLKVAATAMVPVVVTIGGCHYKYVTDTILEFSALDPAGTYKIYADASSTPLGTLIGNATTSANISVGATSFTSTTSLASVLTHYTAGASLLVEFPSIPYNGAPLVLPISAVPTATDFTLAGSFPSVIPPGTSFNIRNFRQMPLTKTLISPYNPNVNHSFDPPNGMKTLLGVTGWNGTNTLSDTIGYRYLNRYTSPLIFVSGAAWSSTFTHNLGRIPTNYMILCYRTDPPGSAVNDAPIILGVEASITATIHNLVVKNRYDSVVARDPITSTNLSSGFLQLVCY